MSRRTLVAGLVLAGIFGTLTACGWVVAPKQASHAYLFAYMCALSIVIGALFLLMIGHAANATWFVPLRRSCEAVVATLPLLCVLFVPILLSLDSLYPWTHPDTLDRVARRHVLEKRALLNEPAFALRAAVLWAVFLVLGELLRRYSLRQDREQPEKNRTKLVALAVGGLPVLALTVTAASFDWLMSLEPSFYSDIYGVYVFAGGFLAALGLFGGMTVVAARSGHLRGVTPEHYYAIGRLELAMVIFWTYIAWAQLMLIWVADLPLETSFYLTRSRHGWLWVGVALVVVHFAIPFALLLFRELKRRPRALFAVSAWLVVVHVLDLYYLVAPALEPKHPAPSLLDLSALLAVAGACMAFAALRARGVAAAPENDPLFRAGLEYEPP